MNQETSKTIATFYKFTPLPEYIEWKRKLLKWGERNEILGTIILAPEGINATVSGTKDGIESFVNLIREDSNFTDLSPRLAESPRSTFYRLRIITRPEIVTLGDPTINPKKVVGKYVEPEDWNQLIRDPNVRVIDTRNEYEVKVGTFKGAENPHTDNFGQWPKYVKNELGKNNIQLRRESNIWLKHFMAGGNMPMQQKREREHRQQFLTNFFVNLNIFGLKKLRLQKLSMP